LKPCRYAVLLVVMALVLALLAPAAAQAVAAQTYVGRIGDFAIHMSLQRNGDDLSGWYYYDSRGIKLTLKGKADGRYFRLAEYDDNGVNTGDFAGAFLADGTLEGFWRDPDGKQFRKNFLALEQTQAEARSGGIFSPGQVVKVPWNDDFSDTYSAKINFTPERAYTVVKDEYGFRSVLRIYSAADTLVLDRNPGSRFEFLTGARGNGKVDLIYLDVHNVSNFAGRILGFGIIGDTGNGIGLLDVDPEQLGWEKLWKMYWPTIVDSSDRIGIEFSRGTSWTRYRIDIVWNEDANRYELTEPVRITPPPLYPATDKIAYFSYSDGKVRCYVGDRAVSQLRLKVGETLLLRHRPGTDDELAVYLAGREDASVLKVTERDGYYVLTGLKPGRIKSGLQISRSWWTGTHLDIIVEP
jgi:hypothetical protein